MATTTEGAPDDLLKCERCGGIDAVQVPEEGGEPRVRCSACGHVREDASAPAPKEDAGKWTVIGPDGAVMTFSSWEKLVASRCPPASKEDASAGDAESATGSSSAPEEKRPSATALLGVTPMVGMPSLALLEHDSGPQLNTSTALGDEGATKAHSENEKEGDETAPLSLRDAIPDETDETRPWRRESLDEEPAPLSLRDAFQIQDKESMSEIVSLRDVVVLSPRSDDSENAVDSTPPPPARGALKTLPPTPSKQGSTAPPPTITVEDKGERKPSAPARAAATESTEEESKGGWFLPALAILGITIVIWRMMAASSEPPPTSSQHVATIEAPAVKETSAAPDPDPTIEATSAPAETEVLSSTTAPETAASATASTAAVATVTATPSAEKKAATPPAAGATSTAANAAKKAAASTPAAGATSTAATAAKKPAASERGMSMSDMLDRAGSARRSGDFATARGLYEQVLRQNAGNVEANGGLGDVARAQGDLPAAKASYERALATSPTYGPAMLGLADTEWDLGNRANAQRHYAQIVERLGDRAPERAKQRGGGTD